MSRRLTLHTLPERILNLLLEIQAHIKSGKVPSSEMQVFDNKSLMALLGIKDRYLKRLRDNGLLGYSRHGDKYWYPQTDIDRFLARCHYAPFSDKL